MTASAQITRKTGIALCEGFSAFTLIRVIVLKKYDQLLLAIVTPIMIFIPSIVERLFSCKLKQSFYLYSLFYAIGPLLGECYSLYYSTSWWDKLLHASGGVMFAIFGIYVFERHISNLSQSVVTVALCALSFSVSVSAIWEICEFGMDVFFGTDMQNDTYIGSIVSTFFADELGATGLLNNIREVSVDGRVISSSGYIDIGLIDTMLDMIIESVGALAVSLIYVFKKGRFSTIVSCGSAVKDISR